MNQATSCLDPTGFHPYRMIISSNTFLWGAYNILAELRGIQPEKMTHSLLLFEEDYVSCAKVASSQSTLLEFIIKGALCVKDIIRMMTVT